MIETMNKQEREEAKLLTNQILAAADDEFYQWLIVHVHTEANLRCIELPCQANNAYIPKNEPDEPDVVVKTSVQKSATTSTVKKVKSLGEIEAENDKKVSLSAEKQLEKKADWTSPLMMPKCKKKAYNQIALHIPKGALLKYTDTWGITVYLGYATGFTKYFVKVKSLTGFTKKVKYSHVIAIDFNSIVSKKK